MHMHRELTMFQEITDTIKHGEYRNATLQLFHKLTKLHCSFLCGSSLYFLATVDKYYLTQFEVDLRRREWQEYEKLEEEHVSVVNFFSIATCGNKGFMYGGSDLLFSESVPQLRQFEHGKKTWRTILPLVKTQSPGSGDSGLVYCPRFGKRADCLISFSGYCDNMDECGYLKELNIFDMGARAWRTIRYKENDDHAPPARAKCSMIYIAQHNQVLMYGGKTTNEVQLCDLWSLDLRDFSWKQVTNVATGDAPERKWMNMQLNSMIVVASSDETTEQLLLYMLNGETLHWTSYRTPLNYRRLYFLSLHQFEENEEANTVDSSRMVLFAKYDKSTDYHIYLIETNTPMFQQKLHSMTKRRFMCDVVIDFSA